MARRYSRSEKEKWTAPPIPAKRPPVRIPANNNEDLIVANRLTIIGRVTNSLVQKPRAVIDFMPQIWNLEGRVMGRDLGLDKFQFSFESENDLIQVLEKGPYHYKIWMLLLQRWEPIVSDSFPSNISFCVKIHGIPLHFWPDSTIHTIGKEFGQYSIKDVKEAKIRVEVNGLQPLTMKMEIQLPTDGVTEVEFEYQKIEKHCFTCFSLLHEETDCPYRNPNAPHPKDRSLGITQRLALQRIEADKKRHDDRRGYRRPDELVPLTRILETSHLLPRRERTSEKPYYERSYQGRREDSRREQSISSRTGRSNYEYRRSNTPSRQYRVVERSRLRSGSSPHQQTPTARSGGVENTGNIPGSQTERIPPSNQNMVTPPARSVKERLGGPVGTRNEGSNSGSKERRSALERISNPLPMEESSIRRISGFDMSRLQGPDPMEEENDHNRQGNLEDTIHDSGNRVPATSRLGGVTTGSTSRKGKFIPIAPQSKVARKRKVARTPAKKRVVRSPLQGLKLSKTKVSRSSVVTRRKLIIDRDNTLPCHKAGCSTQRPTTEPPTTVFIPGSTRGGLGFRPPPHPLP
ncbi:hypothetical protein Bca101_092446 [Brassica carinata]